MEGWDQCNPAVNGIWTSIWVPVTSRMDLVPFGNFDTDRTTGTAHPLFDSHDNDGGVVLKPPAGERDNRLGNARL